MRFFGDHTHSDSRLRAVVTVGSDLLQALVFDVSDSSKTPKAVKKYSWKLPPNFSSDKRIERLHGLLYTILRELHAVPQSILIGIGHSLGTFSFETITVRPTEQKPLKVEDYFRDVPPTRFSPERCELVVPLAYFVNGYRLEEFRKFLKQQSLLPSPDSISASFVGIFLKFHQDVCTQLVGLAKSWGGMPIFFIPSSIPLYLSLQELDGSEEGMIVEIGGDETSLLLFRQKEIIAYTAFPFGLIQFAIAIAKGMNISLEEAEDIHQQYMEGIGTGGGNQERIAKVLGEQADGWFAAFVRALDAFYTAGPISGSLYLAGSGGRISQVQKHLSESGWLNKFSWQGEVKIRTLNAEEIFGGDSLEGNLCGPSDFALAALVKYQMTEKS